jgi:hypothetical protein
VREMSCLCSDDLDLAGNMPFTECNMPLGFL